MNIKQASDHPSDISVTGSSGTQRLMGALGCFFSVSGGCEKQLVRLCEELPFVFLEELAGMAKYHRMFNSLSMCVAHVAQGTLTIAGLALQIS
jgi:hypothetical protein